MINVGEVDIINFRNISKRPASTVYTASSARLQRTTEKDPRPWEFTFLLHSEKLYCVNTALLCSSLPQSHSRAIRREAHGFSGAASGFVRFRFCCNGNANWSLSVRSTSGTNFGEVWVVAEILRASGEVQENEPH